MEEPTNSADLPNEDSSLNTVCHGCKRSFSSRQNLLRHSRICKVLLGIPPREPSFICEKCGNPYSRKSSLAKHAKICGRSDINLHVCPLCNKGFAQKFGMQCHLKKCSFQKGILELRDMILNHKIGENSS